MRYLQLLAPLECQCRQLTGHNSALFASFSRIIGPGPVVIMQWAAVLAEIRFIKFNLTSRAYQTKSSPLEGLAHPRKVPGLYHDRHRMVRSKGPPVRGPLPCRRAQS